MTITRNDLRQLFYRAWTLARGRAVRAGTGAREQFSQALKDAWVTQNRIAADVTAMTDRVMAEVARMRAAKSQPRPAVRQLGRPFSMRVAA